MYGIWTACTCMSQYLCLAYFNLHGSHFNTDTPAYHRERTSENKPRRKTKTTRENQRGSNTVTDTDLPEGHRKRMPLPIIV